MTAQVDEVEPSVSYRMALPEPWVRLPMEPTAMRAAVRAWLLRKYAHRSRDETVQLRRQVEEELVALTRRPGTEYARQMLVLSLEVGQIPVSASCLVSLLPQDLSAPDALTTLAAELADGSVHCEVDDLGSNQAVVVVRDEVVPGARDGRTNAELVDLAGQTMARLRPDDASGQDAVRQDGARQDAVDGAELERLVADAERSRCVDVFIPVPDQPRCLLLTFSTPLVPMFDPLTTLFITLAATVQWRVGDDRWR